MNNDFKFNDELLCEASDISRLHEMYPRVSFAFHFPSVCNEFKPNEIKAASAKRSFLRFGLAAVCLAILALVLAVIEPIYVIPATTEGNIPKGSAAIIAILAAFSGIASVTIGWAGIGIGRRKHDWLIERLICERLRQWHAQYILANVINISTAAHSKEGIESYLNRRDAAFEEFKNKHIRNITARLTEFADLKDGAKPEVWADPDFLNQISQANQILKYQTGDNEAEILNQYFKAYNQIRIQGQLDYTSYTLNTGSVYTHPRAQKKYIHYTSNTSVLVILLLHVCIVIGVIFNIAFLKSPPIYVTAIALALIALGVRVIEDGLQPTAHIVRLRSYLSEITSVREKFSRTQSFRLKYDQLVSFEEAAAREMFDFIKTSEDSNFIM